MQDEKCSLTRAEYCFWVPLAAADGLKSFHLRTLFSLAALKKIERKNREKVRPSKKIHRPMSYTCTVLLLSTQQLQIYTRACVCARIGAWRECVHDSPFCCTKLVLSCSDHTDAPVYTMSKSFLQKRLRDVSSLGWDKHCTHKQ